MSTLYWSLREAASWLKNVWHWPESGTEPPPDVHFCRVGSGNEENIEESGVILVPSHVVLTRTWRITTPVRSAECVGFCQRLCLVVRVDLMFVIAGNETNCAHKIWRERLLAWNIFPQGMLEWRNEIIWNHGCRICVSNRWSSEIQGTALGKSLRAWTCINRSMPAGVAHSRHAFVGGTVSTWGRWRIPVNKRQKRHQKCRSNTHCSRGTCRSDSRFPQLVV